MSSYRIRSKEAGDVYWSERLGWVKKWKATIFTQQDRNILALPPAGFWEQVPVGDIEKIRRQLEKIATAYGIEMEIKNPSCWRGFVECSSLLKPEPNRRASNPVRSPSGERESATMPAPGEAPEG